MRSVSVFVSKDMTHICSYVRFIQQEWTAEPEPNQNSINACAFWTQLTWRKTCTNCLKLLLQSDWPLDAMLGVATSLKSQCFLHLAL